MTARNILRSVAGATTTTDAALGAASGNVLLACVIGVDLDLDFDVAGEFAAFNAVAFLADDLAEGDLATDGFAVFLIREDLLVEDVFFCAAFFTTGLFTTAFLVEETVDPLVLLPFAETGLAAPRRGLDTDAFLLVVFLVATDLSS